MKASNQDIKEIIEELSSIEYGELHIQVRAGQIISYSTIKSKLNKKRLTIKSEYEKDNYKGNGVKEEPATVSTVKR